MKGLSQLVHILLTEIFEADPEAADALFKARVPCNVTLANHPTVQVGRGADDRYEVGVLGVINGILGEAEQPLVCRKYDDETGRLVGFGFYRDPLEAAP